MLDPATFREVVSGAKRGVLAFVLRAGLRLLSIPYGWIVRRRNRTFDDGRRKVERVAATTVSVGNLTVGGTGKTPFVSWLVGWFSACGRRVAIVSRGYGASDGSPNDEARELALAWPDVPHHQNPDRVAAARAAIERDRAEAIVLDDAFQHRRIARDLDIVLIDSLAPFGYDHLLPRGLLREPASGLSRAQVVALSRADLISTDERAAIAAQVRTWAPNAIWVEVTHRPSSVLNTAGERRSVTALAGQRVAAFCGLGNPLGFRRTLESLGLPLVAWRELPDHCPYSPSTIASLDNWIRESSGSIDIVVCTTKDLVKLGRREELGGRPLAALAIEIEFLAGREELESALRRTLLSENVG